MSPLKLFVVSLSALAFAVPTFAAPQDSPIVAAAKAILAKSVKDPSSLQYRSVRSKGGRSCGEFNAKNGFGGYNGFRPFVYDPTVKILAVLLEDNEVMFVNGEGEGVTIGQISELPADERFELLRLKSAAELTYFDCALD